MGLSRAGEGGCCQASEPQFVSPPNLNLSAPKVSAFPVMQQASSEILGLTPVQLKIYVFSG